MVLSEIIKKAKDAGVKQGDLIVIALLLVLSALLLCIGLIGRQDGAAARVCVNGEEVAVLTLSEDVTYSIPGGCGNVLQVTDGRVHMLSAECPDESCVSQGFIFRTGECIVCLPGRVTVTIVSGENAGELDAVAY